MNFRTRCNISGYELFNKEQAQAHFLPPLSPYPIYARWFENPN